MTTWKDRLRDADGALAREQPPEDTQRLKRIVLAAAAGAARTPRWSWPFALTAGSLSAVSAALVLSMVMAPAGADAPMGHRAGGQELTTEEPPSESGPRQLHFSTPGGTRVIWVFDADFEVKGTLP